MKRPSLPVFLSVIITLLIVIATYLAYQNAILASQNEAQRRQIATLQNQQDLNLAASREAKRAADRVIAYLRCTSLIPVENRTPELIDRCLNEDLPPQQLERDGQPSASGLQKDALVSQPAPTGNSSATAPDVTRGNAENVPPSSTAPPPPEQPAVPTVPPEPKPEEEQPTLLQRVLGIIGL